METRVLNNNRLTPYITNVFGNYGLAPTSHLHVVHINRQPPYKSPELSWGITNGKKKKYHNNLKNCMIKYAH